MLRKIVHHPFSQFDRTSLLQEENETLDGGIKKHLIALRGAMGFLIPQIMLATIAPEIFILLSASSFIVLMLCTAWFTISFQNVSTAQLRAGVADFITKKMFRAFLISFDTLIICLIVFLVKTVVPEIVDMIPAMRDITVWIRIVILMSNIAWVVLIWIDVYFASVAYDASDSLLGDGFPTLMRGAQANAKNLPLLQALRSLIRINIAVCKHQNIDIGDIEAELFRDPPE